MRRTLTFYVHQMAVHFCPQKRPLFSPSMYPHYYDKQTRTHTPFTCSTAKQGHQGTHCASSAEQAAASLDKHKRLTRQQ